MAFKNDFRPDIVAGNPPYNNGMDIDFVFDSFEVAKVAVTMIVPAKWQTSEADQRINSKHSYGDFRRELVPHMDKVVFYPDCKDIFSIFQTDGITIYTLDKNNLYNNCTVINKSLNIKEFNSKTYRCIAQKMYNCTEKRSILNGETLINIGHNITDLFKDKDKFKFKIDTANRYQVWINNQYSSSGSRTYANDGTTMVIGVSRIIDSKDETSDVTASSCVFSSDNRDDCIGFINWINSKLVRFLVAMNISKLGPILTDNCFKFVPEPPLDKNGNKYLDKNYNWWAEKAIDNDIYLYYNISDADKNIIEQVIRERLLSYEQERKD